MRLTGIIDRSMDNFFCLRGFAPMLKLANISESIDGIQRDLIIEHSGEMEEFLKSGRFTFFPEVILCVDLQANGANTDAVAKLQQAVTGKQNLRSCKVGTLTFSISSYNKKNQQNSLLEDKIQSSFIDFNETEIIKFLRIDGNHRLSAVHENSTFRDKLTPFCLLFFNGTEETDKFCRALFHNINTKQIPLKTEENLKVIIESNQVFDDEILRTDSSFGLPYLFTRVICQELGNLDLFPQIKQFIGHSKYTYFIGIFEHLIKNGIIKDDEEPVSTVKRNISDINTALHESGITGVTENIAVLGAMTVYKLQGNVAKYKSFVSWIKNNNIGVANNLHIDDVLSIYDSIYENMPKKVFLARWYPDAGEDLEKANGRLDVLTSVIKELDDTLVLRDLGTQGGGTYSIRNLMYSEISASDIFIADLTGCRANVMVEIGFALKHIGAGRMLFYFEPKIGQDGKRDSVPFDLSDFRYEPIADSNAIKTKIKPKLKDILDDIAAGKI